MSQNRPVRSSPPSTPRWVKIFGIIFVILVLTVVAMHLTGTDFGSLHHMP
jgi:hypothetical protein